MESSLVWATALGIAGGLAVPLLYLSVVVVAVVGLFWGRERSHHRLLAGVTAAACAIAVLGVVGVLATGPAVASWPVGPQPGVLSLLRLSVHRDLPSAILLVLVSFLGWVIVRYSRPYLAGEPGVPRYQRWLLATLASVSLLIVSNNLLFMMLAWIAVSLSMHQLLTFYRDRPAARLAARKKFVFGRLAELLLAAAIVLVGRELGTLEIDAVLKRAAGLASVPLSLQVAAVLVVLSVVLKSAQLPFHGWLIQVMEAPTPVSALLHAGVVNLGGYVLIRLSGFLALSPTAQGVLVIVGSLTAGLASLIVLTRVSVKVALAWSTCAQLGFMLLECGLGAYDLALLHLVAHSLYKAQAFLRAGSAVEEWRQADRQPTPAVSLGGWFLWGGVSVGSLHAAGIFTGSLPSLATTGGALRLLVGLALTPLFVAGARRGPGSLLALGSATSLLGFLSHFLQAQLGAAALHLPHRQAAPHWMIAWSALSFLVIFVAQGVLLARPQGRWSRRWYPWFFGGLFLDELFTRLIAKWGERRSPPTLLRAPAFPISLDAAAVPASREVLEQAIRMACQRTAPSWPLDGFIAVNPYSGWSDRSIAEAAAELQLISGSSMLMSRSHYRKAWQAGRLRQEHLYQAIASGNSSWTVERLLDQLTESPSPPTGLPLLCDLVAARDAGQRSPALLSWPEYITHQISQFCAAWFDDGQADWRLPRQAGMYATWKGLAAADRGPALRMGFADFRRLVRQLPETPLELIAFVASELGIPAAAYPSYFAAILLRINGWAAWCAYERFQARKLGRDDDQIVDLLAIRLAWEWLVARAASLSEGERLLFQSQWRAHDSLVAALREQQEPAWLLQRALEQAYQDSLCKELLAAPRPTPEETSRTPEVHAVFCIDVRSEPLRRALEACAPFIRTSGFAGFFGLPIDYTPLAGSRAEARLPGLLAPRLHATETCDAPAGTEHLRVRRQRAAALRELARALRKTASSAFTFVESFGLLYAPKLLWSSVRQSSVSAWLRQDRGEPETLGSAPLRPRLLGDEDLVPTLAGILSAMNLTKGWAPLILLCGHGSTSCNNPHAAALQCGACGGQSGEVNARLLAQLLNTSSLRAGLRQHGIEIPDGTWFVAGLHDTTSDEVRLLDVDRAPISHERAITALRGWLTQAASYNRRTRARRFGLANPTEGSAELRAALHQRGHDWAQVRPEWGLVDNGCLIVAPRQRTRHLDLQGRAFLHDYEHRADTSLRNLELVMTAPMIVTHWINLQYYASTVDPLRYGSGNKVLHNIVGGHLGVFEGNGGDLRIGLPIQCVHDGAALRHTPLRLSVFIEAPCSAIETVLARHPHLAELLRHEWLHLFQIDAEQGCITRFRGGAWSLAASAPAPRQTTTVAAA